MKSSFNVSYSFSDSRHNDEDLRYRELSRYSVVYDEPEPEFDQIVKLVSQVIDVPICGISIVNTSHVWLKARLGVDANCLDRAGAFCAYAVDSNQAFFEVSNPPEDSRFVNNALVLHMGIRYYAAAVLKGNNGYSIGTLWVMDKAPRKLPEKDQLILQGLATQIVSLLNLRYLSPISQLPNLTAFKGNLQCALNQHFTSQTCAIATCKRLLPNGHCLSVDTTENCAIGYIKFLNIYQLNRVFGREQIDRFIEQLAQTIQTCLGSHNMLAQISFSKFVFAYFYHNQPDLEQKLDELQTFLARPFPIKETSASMTATIGISLFSEHGFNVSSLVEQAESAALSILDKPQRSFQLYSKSLESEVDFIVELHQDMEVTQNNQRIIPHYQPQVNILTGELIGFEALARWQHPKYGLVTPYSFLPILEKNDLIFRLDMLIFRAVCQDLTSWLETDLQVKPIACNFARTSLLHPDLKEIVRRILNEFSIPKGLIEIEITENGLAPNNKIIKNINYLNEEFGLKIAIDDFGTGLSNLEILRQIHFNRLKVDRQFVNDVANNVHIAGILNLVNGVAKLFQRELLCEGVEKYEDLAYLQKAGIGNIQGWLISQALPKSSVQASLKRFDIPYSKRKILIKNPLKMSEMFCF